MPQRHPSSGFTLMEVLVAISIASVLSMIAVPATTTYIKQYELTGAANQVAFDISRARMQAVAQNRLVRIRFLDAQHYVRESSSDGVSYTSDDAAPALPSSISAESPPTTTFSRSGLAAAATTITLSNASGTKTIRTNLLGKVTIS